MSGEEADGSKPQGGGVHYGTFQGPPSYPPPRPPPSLSAHHRGDYQAVPGNAAAISFLEYFPNSLSRRTIYKTKICGIKFLGIVRRPTHTQSHTQRARGF